MLDHPNYRGIGIDEESAVVVKPNSTIEVIGNSNVMLFEPYKAVAGKGHAKSFKLTILYPGIHIICKFVSNYSLNSCKWPA